VAYILTDLASLPPSMTPGYTEKNVGMPHAYLPNDYGMRSMKVLETVSGGSKEESFLFASNNHNGKLDPRTFRVWTNVLRRSLSLSKLRLRKSLWTFHMNNEVESPETQGLYATRWPGTIGNELAESGLPRSSLSFLPRVPDVQGYFAIMAHADLALDTIAYGGQTTTLDTLATGLPVLTLPGEGQVARFTYAAMQACLGQESHHGIAASAKEYEDTALAFVA